MLEKIQAVRGMNDFLPDECPRWQYLESVIKKHLANYGYREIRSPIVEKSALFKRSVGAETDIVAKEMYTFDDRNGDSLTLRPEGTACCVRAGIEHGLFYNQIQRLWYMGAYFRHERPQKGRYRQFHQVGVEAVGMASAAVDVEMIAMTASLWKALRISQDVTLELNTLGSFAVRKKYRDDLVVYLKRFEDELDDDSQRRLVTNPLRILDSKNPAMREIIDGAPKLVDFLDEESKAHFDTVCSMLDELKISYVLNPTLVRGLDYYCHTVFEWVTEKLGAQGTICAGGRYDGLIEQLGGKATPATGFAMGLERILELLPSDIGKINLDAYLLLLGDITQTVGFKLAEQLRAKGVSVVTDCSGASMKSQLKKANVSGARYALILGEQELQNHQIMLKPLREKAEQQEICLDDLGALVANLKTA